MQEKMVTFAVGKGNETHLQAEHLDTLEDHVKSIDKTLVDVQTESTYLWIRLKSHMKGVESIRTRVLAFCVVEFLIPCRPLGFPGLLHQGLALRSAGVVTPSGKGHACCMRASVRSGRLLSRPGLSG
eukprot:UN0197